MNQFKICETDLNHKPNLSLTAEANNPHLV